MSAKHYLKLVPEPKVKYRPYSAGFVIDGVTHAKKCDCTGCAKIRAGLFKKHLKMPSYPEEPQFLDQTVFVRPHFRRQANHFNKMPRTRSTVRALVRAMLKGGKP